MKYALSFLVLLLLSIRAPVLLAETTSFEKAGDQYSIVRTGGNLNWTDLLQKAQSLSGQQISELQGQPLILTFSATYCVTCHDLVKYNQPLAAALKGELDFLQVLIDQNELPKAMHETRVSPDLNFMILETEGLKVTDKLELSWIPDTFVLNRQGQILYRGCPLFSPKAYLKAVQMLLDEKAKSENREATQAIRYFRL